MFKECPKCETVYGGSSIGAMAQNANPKNKIGYFGSHCRCGAKLSESYDWHGVGNRKKVYASEWRKWRQSLSEKKHRKIFGGPKDATIYRFDYHEVFLAKNQKTANKKFLKLWRSMRRHTKGLCWVFTGICGYYSPGMYCANYAMKTARSFEEVKTHLALKRQKLGVTKPY